MGKGPTTAAKMRGGRMGGIYTPGRAPPAGALAAMQRALGPDAVLLDSAGRAADADALRLDGTRVSELALACARVSELDGAFALAWFAEQGELRLASDAIGQRAIYYAELPQGGLVFASSLHGVLASGLVERRLCLDAVPLFLTFAYVPGPRTLVEGVRRLPPGHVLEAGPSGLRLRPYFRLPSEPVAWESEQRMRPRLRAALEAAVGRALPAPGEPLGATLSGGIDSSLVLALARRQHEGAMTCYSVSFGPEHANELPFSQRVAAHTGVAQIVVDIQPEDVARELDITVAALSEPNGDPLTVPNLFLFRRAQEQTEVVLNGEGGDPCFGGPKNAPMLLAELLGDGTRAPDRHARARRYLRAHQKCYDDLSELLSSTRSWQRAGADMEELVTSYFEDARWTSLLDKLMAINVAFKGGYHIFPKIDHLSFPARVCPRSPLFDRRIVELSFELAPALKRRGAIEKHLLKESVRDLLPRAIIERPKSGMMVPVEAWFRGPLRELARERLLGSLTSWDLVQRRWLEELIDARHGGLRPRRGVKIWLMLTLEAWLRCVLRGEAPRRE